MTFATVEEALEAVDDWAADEPLEVLAGMCGFNDTAQMRRSFSRIREMTPSTFRQMHLSPKKEWRGPV